MNKYYDLNEKEEERALSVYRKAIVIDASDSTTDEADTKLLPDWGKYLDDSLIAGGTTAFFGNVGGTFTQTVKTIYDWYCKIEQYDNLILATRAEEIINAKSEGKVAVLFQTQNTSPIEGDLSLLTILYKLGLRSIGLTYNTGNLVGDGCAEKRNSGLSDFGVKVVEEMNRLGILLDLSHVGYQTSMEAIELSEDPVIFSHSNVLALCNVFRNLRNDQIKAMAEKDGVIGIASISSFLKQPIPYTENNPRPTIDDVLNHIDYVVDLVGANHVGLGLDLAEYMSKEFWDWFHQIHPEYGPMVPHEWRYAQGLEIHSEIINVARGLVVRGYSDQDIEKILGGNFIRVYQRVLK